MRETQVRSLGREDPLEKVMATHSRILTWRMPWKEEPGGLQSMGSKRAGHDWATNTFTLSDSFINKLENNKWWEVWTPVHCWWGHEVVQLLCSRIWQFLKKSNIASPWSGNFTSEIKSRNMNRYFSTHVYSSIIHNGQKAEATQMPTIWVDKIQYGIHIY